MRCIERVQKIKAGAWLDPARVIGFGLEFILEIRSGQVKPNQIRSEREL